MKKRFFLVAIAAVLMSGAFAQNHHFGIDITSATNFGMWQGKDKDSGNKMEAGFCQPQFRISSFNGIWLDHMLGVYGAVGVGGNIQFGQKVNGSKFGGDRDIGVSVDFATGPCFGVDIGTIRFNVGVGLHINGANTIREETIAGVKTKYETTLVWMGLAVSPQFRFTADRRCSFVVGSEFFFDGCLGGESKVGNINRDIELEESIRFSISTYIGVGINFGS